MKDVEHLPAEERRHYIQCECGEWFDCRDLAEVFQHQHAYNLPEPTCTHVIKVGEPTIYCKDQKTICGN